MEEKGSEAENVLAKVGRMEGAGGRSPRERELWW